MGSDESVGPESAMTSLRSYQEKPVHKSSVHMVGILKDLESGKFADSAHGFKKKFFEVQRIGSRKGIQVPKLEARRSWCIR